jgi:hypothetical protein
MYFVNQKSPTIPDQLTTQQLLTLVPEEESNLIF